MLKKSLYVIGMLFLFCGIAYAESTSSNNIGAVATNITGNFTALGKLMIAIAYLSGFGFSVAAIFKFKQHKDNPTQIPLGTPIALLVVGIVLIFMPGLLQVGGATAGLGTAGGFTGEGVEKLQFQL